MAKKITTEDFIERANKIHNNNYDYSLVDYKNNKTKVKIKCNIHGIFEQVSGSHLRGYGCRKCAIDNMVMDKNTFIEKANKIHNNKYDYSLVEYNNNKDKIIIGCSEHGNINVELCSHLRGSGCFQCYHDNKRLNTEDFINKAKKVHGDKYDYSLVDYKLNNTKVKIICPVHGEFEQLPNGHLLTSGCSKCGYGGVHGRYNSKYFKLNPQMKVHDGVLYIIKFNDNSESFFKIGITRFDVKYRLTKISKYKNVDIIYEHKTTLHNAYKLEKKLHKKLKQFKYIPELKFDGCQECFINIDEKIPLIINRLKSL